MFLAQKNLVKHQKVSKYYEMDCWSCQSTEKSRENKYIGQIQKRQTWWSSTIGVLLGFLRICVFSIIGGSLVWLLLVYDFQMFGETILSLRYCWQGVWHCLCLRNKTTAHWRIEIQWKKIQIQRHHQDHLDFVKHLINVYLLKKVYINS